MGLPNTPERFWARVAKDPGDGCWRWLGGRHVKGGYGREARGERVGTAKLTAKDVRQIRKRYKQGGISQFALGCLYDVAQYTIHRIVSGKGWQHV